MAQPNGPVIVFLLFLTLFGVKSLHLFAASNGLLAIFGQILESRTLPNDVPLVPLTTNGWSPAIDWQIRAPTVFCWSFTGDGTHPDTTLSGLLFVGAWGPAWLLIVLESLRRGNSWRVVSFDSIWGILIFNHAHAVMTPVYLAVHLLTSPTALTPMLSDVLIDRVDLQVLPLSFMLGYLLPLVLLALPAPSMVSLVFKQTVMGWYQQWNLFISIPHFFLVLMAKKFHNRSSEVKIDKWRYITDLRVVYAFAFLMSAISHWTVMVISFTSSLWPGLFNPSLMGLLLPSHLLLPTSPFSGAKVKDLAQGFMWVIQWDYIIGTTAMVTWSLAVHARGVAANGELWSGHTSVIWRVLLYTVLGGPAGAAVAIIWERDEILLGKGSEPPVLNEETESSPLL